jgi:hypothetical protein
MLQVRRRVVMSARIPVVVSSEAGAISAKRRAEIDSLLEAIVDAIAAGKLPPDDACAWAKIAAIEVEQLGFVPPAETGL